MIFPRVENPWSRMTISEFQRMARPSTTPFGSIWYELQVHQHLLRISYMDFPTHLVSWRRRMSKSSILIQFWRILCLDLPLRPLMFWVMTFMVNSFVGGKRSSKRACVSVMSWSCSCQPPWWVVAPFSFLIFCSPLGFFSGLSLDPPWCLVVLWPLLMSIERPCEIF